MWQALRKQTFRLLYFLGKEPPSSAEIGAELERLRQEPKTTFDKKKETGERCDCLVTAANRTVDCYPGTFVYACDLIGDTKPGLVGTPLPLGSCKNIPKERS
jgi:hypothetical protein